MCPTPWVGRVSDTWFPRCYASATVGSAGAAGAVDLRGRGDEADVAERLREVAEQLAARRVDLLRDQAEVVRVADEPVEQLLGPLDLARLRERRDEPEGADHERP